MNPTESAELSAKAWAEALAQVGRADGGQALAEQLLELLKEASGASGTALYLGTGASGSREIVVGRGDFPRMLCAPADEAFARLDFPGSTVLAEPATANLTTDPGLQVALAAAAQNLRLEGSLKRQRFEVNYRGVELQALYDVGLAIASTLNLEELSEAILLRSVSLLDARFGALYLARDSCYRLDRTFGGEAVDAIEITDERIQRLLSGDESEAQDLVADVEHLLVVPIEADGETMGLLIVADKESRHGVGPFQRSDRQSLKMLATQAAIALQNAHLHQQALEKERLEREAQLAAEIQRRLLPEKLPHVKGLELIGWNRPARQVGGDYYDFMPLAGGLLGAVVADVTGKGMPAALMVSTLYSALRLLLDRERLGPELVARLNHHIFESSAPNKFITLLVASINPASGEVAYLNAGHNPGFLIREGGELEKLPPGGMPLGLFAGGDFRGETLTMNTGDLLCFYSDGITECAAPDDEEFGEGRLTDLLRECAAQPLPRIVADIDDAVTAFAAGLPQGDDQTLVLLRKMPDEQAEG